MNSNESESGGIMQYEELVKTIIKTDKHCYDLRDDKNAYRSSLKQQVELADKLYAYLSAESGVPDVKLMDRIMDDTNWRASDWLLGLPFELGYGGMIDEAVSVSRRFAEVYEPENFLGDLAVVLAEAGRRDEALEQIEENLRRFPDDVWVVIKAGDAFHELDEDDRAIELLQRAYELSEPMSYDREGVLERLVPILREKVRDGEADALLEKDRESRVPVRPAQTAKIGRNETCPCGSGTKYKKCCLGKEP